MSTTRLITFFAGFDGEEKVTAWYRSRDKPWSIMRRRKRQLGGALTIRSQTFIEKRGKDLPSA